MTTPTPAEVLEAEMDTADVLEAAADWIRVHGLTKGYRWPIYADETLDEDVLAGPCCVIGAIHRADGLGRIAETERSAAHQALADTVGLPPNEYIFEWSDSHSASEVIDALMEAAARLRLATPHPSTTRTK